MKKHTHHFVDTYQGLGAFGMDRGTDEETIIFYLQKFSDDTLISALIKRMSDTELNEIYMLINRMLKAHLSETEYHRLFLKDGTHDHP
ncbi:MAG: cytoplasmic protein [Thermodesulfobacteriota bacterium]